MSQIEQFMKFKISIDNDLVLFAFTFNNFPRKTKKQMNDFFSFAS